MSNAAQQMHQQLGVNDALFMKNVQGGDWDEIINGFEANLRSQIGESANLAKMAYDTVTAAGTMTPEFSTLASGVLRDLKIYSERFGMLVLRRNGRTGRTRSSEEYTEYMAIGLEMSNLSEELRLVVGDVMFNLNDGYTNALEVLRAREAEAASAEQTTEAATDQTTEATAEQSAETRTAQ